MSGEEEAPRPRIEAPNTAATEREDGKSRVKREPVWITLLVLAIIAIFLIVVREVLTPFIVAGVLAYIAAPAVKWVQKRTRLPRPAAVFGFFLIFIVPIGVLIYLLEPALVSETKELATNTPAILGNLLYQIFGGNSVELLGQTFDAGTVSDYLLHATRSVLGTPSEAIHVASSILGALLHAFLSIVLLFYFLLSPISVGQLVLRLIPAEYRPHWRRVGREVHEVMGHYVRGLVFLVFLMAAVTWVGLTAIFHLPFALPIALATGFLEIIPFVGPVIAASIAAVVGLFYGGAGYAASIALFYFIIREIEDQLVMPNVIGRAVEIPPALAIFAVLAGQAIAGVLGALLGIPMAAAVKIGFDRWRPPQEL
ncbi:MAG TPA: AI-2E family transporter [Chloroflexota bacterium]|nr:AI-2E family transporter [Chloroflexota bacterium]